MTHTGATKRGCSEWYPLYLQLTTTVISKEDCPPSFCDVYLLWKLKCCLCHTYYYILLNYVSLKSHVDKIVLCVAKKIFSFKGVATNNKSKIHLLFDCTSLLSFYSNTNTAIYHLFFFLSSCVIFAVVFQHVIF